MRATRGAAWPAHQCSAALLSSRYPAGPLVAVRICQRGAPHQRGLAVAPDHSTAVEVIVAQNSQHDRAVGRRRWCEGVLVNDLMRTALLSTGSPFRSALAPSDARAIARSTLLGLSPNLFWGVTPKPHENRSAVSAVGSGLSSKAAVASGRARRSASALDKLPLVGERFTSSSPQWEFDALMRALKQAYSVRRH
jgi:hypothetical protein